MLIMDAMVLIHLAKVTLLEKTCGHFRDVAMPEAVHGEAMAGKEKGYPDAKIIADMVERKRIAVRHVENKALIKKAETFSIQKGEAEAVALYWQEKARYLATDDDNVRKKSVLLDIKVIGTPAIILKLHRENMIGKEKFAESLEELRKIGWFSSSVIDKLLMEGLKWDKQ